MQTSPRTDWKVKVEEVGMNYHTIDNKMYWNENAFYCFSSEEIDKIEAATDTLHSMCLEYVSNTIRKGDYDSDYNFDDYDISLIEKSWTYGHPYIYGRFDLGIGVDGKIKLFEYNADTPTGLLEASVVQWNWKKDIFNTSNDQFNSIHEELIKSWYKKSNNKIYFSTNKEASLEDWGNIHYLLETAAEANKNVSSIDIEEIGYCSDNNIFVDINNKPIEAIFKLYPWEWFKEDSFYKNIKKSTTVFIEPPWKMLLSNKLLCVKLWEMFPNHDLLLESHKSSKKCWPFYKRVLRKPMLGREGQGIYDLTFLSKKETGYIEQEKFDSLTFNNLTPVIGSWIIQNTACGIGIREDVGITTNNSCFVPHIFNEDGYV